MIVAAGPPIRTDSVRQKNAPQHRKRTLIVLRTVVGTAVLAFSISSCGGGDDAEEEPSVSATQVCASTLDSSAATALQHMGDTEKFTELPGVDDSGESNKFSLKRAASTIHNDVTQRNQCVIFKAGDKTGHPLINLDFSAEKYHPNTGKSADDEESVDAIYPIGVYAKTYGNVSATIYFKCSTHEPGKTQTLTPYVKAYLYSTPDQASSKSTGRDLITVLNAVSRGMAKQLGCASQAGLPSKVPNAGTN
jgi:hypothetical protein